MATISYFEQTLPDADDSEKEHLIEIFVRSFGGEHELYLKHEDADGTVSDIVFNKHQMLSLLDSLDDAAHYLSYRE